MFGSAASRALSPEARAARVARLRAATDFLGGAHNLIAPVFLRGRLGLDGGVAATRLDVDGAPDDAYYAWFEPTGTPRLNGTLVYLHGGGFIIGSKATNGEMLPEAPFPGALVDALRGVGVALASTPPERLILGGDSAGASLALAALHFLRETLQITPAAGLLLSPMVDIASELEYATDTTNVGPDLLPRASTGRREFMDMYRGPSANATLDAFVDALRRRRDGALLSPLAASPRQLGALPPLLCQAGGSEVLLDSQLRFCDAARRAGADVRCTVFDGEVHAFHAFGFSPAWPAARADLRRFCERALRPAAPAAVGSPAVVAALVGGSRKRAAVAAGIRAFR
ncbi:carboxylic ester hydrolase [Aureococcus anophagefferens]|nr:carboxylic ester hydrolase [Aureococcus anophagefferens]